MKFLFRSMLYVPSYNEKFIMKALESEADAIIFDLEDSCPVEKMEEGREKIRNALDNRLSKDRQILIRVNELGTDYLEKDLQLLKYKGILGIMPPKISSAEEMAEFDRLVSEKEVEYGLTIGSIKFTPLVETAGAVVNLDLMAQTTDRIIALAFGGEDYLDSIWGVHTYPPVAFDFPRAMVVQVARKYGMLPIDTPYLDIKNEEGYITEEKKSAAMGFAGDLLINPKQIPWANRVFSPSEEEISHARRVMAAVKEAAESGGSIAVLDGKMVGPPMRKRAEKVTALADIIEQHSVKRASIVSSETLKEI